MGVRVKEILKSDSLAGSRIVINNNFKAIKADIATIDEFFLFDEETGDRIGLTSPLLQCNNIEAEKIKNLQDKELVFYKDNLPCLKFNENGHLIIRKDSTLDLDLQAKLEELASNRLDINGVANQVEENLLNDNTFWTLMINKLVNNSAFIDLIVEKILGNVRFQNQVIEWIEQYAPTPPVEKCTDFSVYAKTSKLWLHCNTEQTRDKDIKLSDYMPVEGDTMTIKKSDIQPIIDEFFDGTGEEFALTYTDSQGDEHKITENGEYEDYNINGELESIIICEDYDGDTTYIITQQR